MLTTSREPLDVAGEVVWRVPSLPRARLSPLFVERAGQPAGSPRTGGRAGDQDDLCAAGRHPAGPGTGSRLARHPHPAADRGRSGRPVRPAGPRYPGCGGAAADAGGLDRLELRPARSSGPCGVPPAGRVRRRVHARCRLARVLPTSAGVASTGLAGRLVDKSLVVARRTRGTGCWRRCASTPRGRLDDPARPRRLRDRHLDYFLRAAEEAARTWTGPDRDAWRAGSSRSARTSGPPSSMVCPARTGRGAGWPRPFRGCGICRGPGRRGSGICAGRSRAARRQVVAPGPPDLRVAQVADTAAPFGLDAAQRGLEIATELGDDSLRARCLAMVAVGRYYLDFQAPGIAARRAGCWRSPSATRWPGTPPARSRR